MKTLLYLIPVILGFGGLFFAAFWCFVFRKNKNIKTRETFDLPKFLPEDEYHIF